MSSPIPTAARPRLRRPTVIVVVIAVAAIAVAGIVTLGLLQGPRLSSAQIDIDRVTERSGEQLTLTADHELSPVEASDVTITPDAEFAVTTAGAQIAVRFAAPLAYGERYVVEVGSVTAAGGDRSSTLRHEFTTGTPPIYYLDRGDTTDEIVRTAVKGNERTVVYSAPRIQQFAVLGTAAAVTTELDDGTSALSLVSFDDGGVEPIALPAPARIELLDAADDSLTVAFTISTDDGRFDDHLVKVFLEHDRDIEPVLAADGNPLQVANWFFVPGGTTLAAHDERDDSVLLVDTQSGAVTALGEFTSLESVSTDATRLGVRNEYGPVSLPIDGSNATEFAPSSIGGATPYPGDFQFMRGGRLVQHVIVVDYATSAFENLFVVDDGEASRELFRTIDEAGSIGRIRVSPNDQFAAVEVVPNVEASVSDGRSVEARATSITTVFVEISSGAVTKSVPGFDLHW